MNVWVISRGGVTKIDTELLTVDGPLASRVETLMSEEQVAPLGEQTATAAEAQWAWWPLLAQLRTEGYQVQTYVPGLPAQFSPRGAEPQPVESP